MKVNTIGLNSVRLNTIALNHIGEIRSGGGGSKPSPIPQWIREHVVFYYDVKKQGATNETLKESASLQDLSGKGRRMKLNNFLFDMMSGVDGYKNETFETVPNNTNIKWSHLSYYSIEGKPTQKSTDFGLYRVKNNVNKVLYLKWNIEGIQEGNKVYLAQYNNESTRIELTNGVNDIAFDTTNSDNPGYGSVTIISDQPYSTDITITQIPEYPGALVTDGLDDYGLVENLSSGVKMLFMTVNPMVSNIMLYDQRFQRDELFQVYSFPNRVAYILNINNSEMNKQGKVYINGKLNTTIVANDLLNVKHIVTVTANDLVAVKKRHVFFNSSVGVAYYAKLAFYNSIAFDSIPTEADGFTEQELIDYVLTNIIGQ